MCFCIVKKTLRAILISALIFLYNCIVHILISLPCNAKVRVLKGNIVHSEVTGSMSGPDASLCGFTYVFQQFKDVDMRETGLGVNWPLNGCWSCPGCNSAFAGDSWLIAPATPATLKTGAGCRKRNRTTPARFIHWILVFPKI